MAEIINRTEGVIRVQILERDDGHREITLRSNSWKSIIYVRNLIIKSLVSPFESSVTDDKLTEIQIIEPTEEERKKQSRAGQNTNSFY